MRAASASSARRHAYMKAMRRGAPRVAREQRRDRRTNTPATGAGATGLGERGVVVQPEVAGEPVRSRRPSRRRADPTRRARSRHVRESAGGDRLRESRISGRDAASSNPSRRHRRSSSAAASPVSPRRGCWRGTSPASSCSSATSATTSTAPEDAFRSWRRGGVPQLRHSHAFLARLRLVLLAHMPDVLERLRAERRARDRPRRHGAARDGLPRRAGGRGRRAPRLPAHHLRVGAARERAGAARGGAARGRDGHRPRRRQRATASGRG